MSLGRCEIIKRLYWGELGIPSAPIAIHKPQIGRLVVGCVIANESLLLYVFYSVFFKTFCFFLILLWPHVQRKWPCAWICRGEVLYNANDLNTFYISPRVVDLPFGLFLHRAKLIYNILYHGDVSVSRNRINDNLAVVVPWKVEDSLYCRVKIQLYVHTQVEQRVLGKNGLTGTSGFFIIT